MSLLQPIILKSAHRHFLARCGGWLLLPCCLIGILAESRCYSSPPQPAQGFTRFIPWMAKPPSAAPSQSPDKSPPEQLYAPEIRQYRQEFVGRSDANPDAVRRGERPANTAPAISLTVVAAPRRQVGSGSTFHLTVKNTSRQPIEDVYARAEFCDGLAMPGQAEHHVVRPLGRLAGRESREMALTLFGVDEGKKVCTFSVYAEGAAPVAKTVGVEFVRRRLDLRLLGPRLRTVGTRAEFTAKLTNISAVPMTGLIATVRHDACFVQRSGSAGAERSRGNLQWKLGALKPGEGVQMQVEFDCLNHAEHGRVMLEAIADAFPGDEIELAPQVVAAEGALALEIDDSDERLRAGEEMVYTVFVRNRSRLPVRTVRLVADVPEIFEPLDSEVLVDKRALAQKANRDGRMLEFAPIDVLAAGSVARYQVRVRATLPGEGEFRARVTEATSQWTGEVAESTTVNP
ncbi:MAG: hypothetical protein WD648_07355 [Planctomycetaceae bacterium]